MKISSILKALKKNGNFDVLLVHTGQHYDKNMSHLFFDELGIPEPDVNLEVGSGSHAVQTAEIMRRFEPVVLDFKPDYVLVVGDVNSTIACGLVAVKLGVKLIHVEAGLRSFDRTMPEEINRILTDSISDYLFATEESAIDNLKNEGVNLKYVHFVGNVMIDTLMANRETALKSDICSRLGIDKKQYAVITLHRPGNVDDFHVFNQIIEAFETIEKETKLIFPIHPRTKSNLEKLNLSARIKGMKNLIITEPLGYLDFLCLTSNALFVMTDSGGLQEETTILGIPCMTLRNNTERPVTITDGTNRLIPVQKEKILEYYYQIKQNGCMKKHAPKLWDGKAAERIVDILYKECNYLTKK
jgi:UDP-N-acetylglucosamine 2-epimerase (non-hydrolysing)